jgi:hypothetical protein
MRLAVACVLVLVCSGCVAFQKPPPAAVPCPSTGALFLPDESSDTLFRVDGRMKSDVLVMLPGSGSVRVEPSVPSTWKWDIQRIGPTTDNATFVRVGFAPPPLAPPAGRQGPPKGPPGGGASVFVNWTLSAAAGCAGQHGGASYTRTIPMTGAVAQPGKGVHVHYAGFWLNGTLFGTDIASVDSSSWPRAGWYQFDGGEALPVYVYDKDRSERPAVWAPQDAVPRDAPVPRQSGVFSYYTTIVGFNDALKGLSTSANRVVVVPPERAYTRPGNEKHVLYGDALVFFISIDEVVDVPCPKETPNRSVCHAVPER